MTVKGCSSLTESLNNYTAIETLNDENRIFVDNYGLQDVKKRILFHSFPPILQFQLKRFEYDPLLGDIVKIHDKFTFPDTLDLNSFVTTNNNNNQYHYQLFGYVFI